MPWVLYMNISGATDSAKIGKSTVAIALPLKRSILLNPCKTEVLLVLPPTALLNIAKYFRHFENLNERRPHKFWTKALNSDLSDVSAFR